MYPADLTIIAGFVAGFAGSIHCVAMCGGLVGVVSATMKASPGRALIYWSCYHFGRISSYIIAGMVAGGVAGMVADIFAIDRTHDVGSIIAGIFLIILAGHVAQWWNLLSIVEQAGGRLWQKVVPLFSRYLTPKLHRHAIIGGLLWGWIPCGLVYSTLVVAAASTDAIGGGLTMAAFGIGTLPMLIVMGVVAGQLERFRKISWLRNVFAILLCALGAAILVGILPLHA